MSSYLGIGPTQLSCILMVGILSSTDVVSPPVWKLVCLAWTSQKVINNYG